jgi:undecaprenyl pyrophosphate synthase
MPKQVDKASDKAKKEPTKINRVSGNNTKLKSLLPKDLEKTIKNPETGRMIKIKSALGYDEKSKVFQAAQRTLKKK